MSRSWTILGHALRHATALGLHLKVADSAISMTDRIRRARTWHSLYCLEILVSEVTGRPRAIAISDITTPVDILEAPVRSTAISEQISTQYGAEAGSRRQWQKFLEQERPGSTFMLSSTIPLRSLVGIGNGAPASHFTHRIRLCFISHRIGTALYSANENHSWSDLQDRTNMLEKELLLWTRSLPSELTMQGPHNPHVDPRSKIELAMYYNSIRMILYRPCLCNIHIPNESRQSKDFDLESARKCVEAAISMTELMPDLRTAQEGFQLLPWWCLLHYTSQAVAVLLLEMCLNFAHFPGELERLVFALKRAMLYIYRMTSASRSAYKAWKIFRQVLDHASMEFAELDISDLPVDAPQPPNWSPAFEASLRDQDLAAQSPLVDFLQFPQN
jgi:Fungal specific transcription factor domain